MSSDDRFIVLQVINFGSMALYWSLAIVGFLIGIYWLPLVFAPVWLVVLILIPTVGFKWAEKEDW